MSNSKLLAQARRHLTPMLFLALAPACGKPATVEDCERIVTRITELELAAAEIERPEDVQQQVNSTRELFSEAAQRECVGRRISAGTLNCVEQATTAEQIVEECFN